MQIVADAVKIAFRTSPIKAKKKLLIDWITKGDTPGVVTGAEWDSTYFAKENVDNGNNYQPYKPFILSDSMRLGDNVRLLSDKYENGYLSVNRSDVNGEYGSAEVISKIYTSVHPATHLTVVSSPYNYLVSFDLYYRDETDTSWELCASYINQSSYSVVYEFASKTNIKGWKLEITKISLANMLASVVEVQTGFRDDVSADLIKDDPIEIRKEFEYQSEKSLSIGNITANSLLVKLQNTHQRYNPRNTESDIYPYLKANKVLRPYIGIDLGTSVVYIAQGVFYGREIIPKPGMTCEMSALDRMFFLNDKDFVSSILYEDHLISELVEHNVIDFGLGASEYSIDATTGTIPFAWFEPRRYAENIKRLAIAEGGVATFDELDVFNFKKRGWTSSTIAAYYNDNHILKKSAACPFIAQNMKNYISIKSNPLVLQAETTIYSNTQTITLAAGETRSIPCYFSKKPCKDVANATIVKDAEITLDSESIYAYATFLVFTNTAGVDKTITSITILGKALESTGSNVVISKDDDLIDIYGKSEYNVDSEFMQDMEFAQSLADDLKDSYKDPDADLEFESLSLPYLQLGDLVGVQNSRLNIGQLIT